MCVVDSNIFTYLWDRSKHLLFCFFFVLFCIYLNTFCVVSFEIVIQRFLQAMRMFILHTHNLFIFWFSSLSLWLWDAPPPHKCYGSAVCLVAIDCYVAVTANVLTRSLRRELPTHGFWQDIYFFSEMEWNVLSLCSVDTSVGQTLFMWLNKSTVAYNGQAVATSILIQHRFGSGSKIDFLTSPFQHPFPTPHLTLKTYFILYTKVSFPPFLPTHPHPSTPQISA